MVGHEIKKAKSLFVSSICLLFAREATEMIFELAHCLYEAFVPLQFLVLFTVLKEDDNEFLEFAFHSCHKSTHIAGQASDGSFLVIVSEWLKSLGVLSSLIRKSV